MMAAGDKTGWKRGAGPYSKNYAKTDTPSPYKLYADRDHPKGREIDGAVGKRQAVNEGHSGVVSRGKRPAHKAGSWKRV
jgi:hypothetical protein